MPEEKKLFLLDAYALIFRAYYAFIRNPRVTSKGFNTSAIFGFVNSLEEVMRTQQPTHIAVVFDAPGKTFRAEEFEFYKANRQETPEDIKAAEPWIRDIIKAYNIPVIEAEGYEADDVIATLAKEAAQEGYTVYMMTPDKDFAQVVDENIYIYKPGRQGKPAEVLGIPEVRDKFQVEQPVQVIDILGLMGDSVDNIPGIPGVGEKTAIKLINQFGSIEEMYNRTNEIKGKLREKVEENKQAALDSKKLATIILDVPVPFEPEKLIKEDPDTEKLSGLFHALEFRTLGERVLGNDFAANKPSGQGNLFSRHGHAPVSAPTGRNIDNTEHTYTLVDTNEQRASLLADLKGLDSFAFDTETHGLDAHTTDLLGISFSWKPHHAFFMHCPADREAATAILRPFAAVFDNPEVEKIGHNIKFDIEVLRQYGINVRGPIYDTMVAQYVSNSDVGQKLDHMAESHLGYKMVPITDLIGKKGKKRRPMRDTPLEQLKEYAAEDADITFQLKGVTEELVRKVKAEKLLNEVEFPLIYVLTDMESFGVKLDEPFLSDYSAELTGELVEIRDKIYQAAGQEFNLDSPKQLGPILFEDLGIPYTGKKTKTGQYSTAEDVLSKHKEEHEIIGDILTYRELTKLKSTYVDALPQLINAKTGRVHTTFGQTVAATGRLSSIQPNLQNIPVRT
ncbi:MAG: DNA polymerase, partial [Saprospiraceae bacterium]|nr:DNA polymerase [Saprospiraceae bacterium]